MKVCFFLGALFSVSTFAATSAKSPFDLEIPPPATVYAPVLRNLPGSLPEYQRVSLINPSEESELQSKGLFRMSSQLRPREIIRVFASDGPLNHIGNTLEPENETGVAANSEYIFVKVKKGEAGILDRLLVVRDQGPLEKAVKDREKFEMRGELIRIQAEIQLTSLVASDKPSSDYDFYRARVVQAIDMAKPGDLVIRGKLETTEFSASGPRNGLVSDIIGGEYAERSSLWGEGMYVFINKGSNEGVKVGDILPIFINRKLRIPDSLIAESTLSQGLLKVVHVDKGVATALVVKADTGLRQGDRTGSLAENTRSEEPVDVAPPENDGADSDSLIE